MKKETNHVIEEAIKIAGGQMQLAAISGVAQATINKLLHKKSKEMRSGTIVKLSRATGIPKDRFL